MRILPLLCFWVSLVFAASLCYGDDKTVEVVGFGECADCEQSNIKTKHAFSGNVFLFWNHHKYVVHGR